MLSFTLELTSYSIRAVVNQSPSIHLDVTPALASDFTVRSFLGSTYRPHGIQLHRHNHGDLSTNLSEWRSQVRRHHGMDFQFFIKFFFNILMMWFTIEVDISVMWYYLTERIGLLFAAPGPLLGFPWWRTHLRSSYLSWNFLHHCRQKNIHGYRLVRQVEKL